MPKIYDEPSDVTNTGGVVKVNGPDGVEVSLTPEAAVKTGVNLIANAAQAKGDADIEANRENRKS